MGRSPTIVTPPPQEVLTPQFLLRNPRPRQMGDPTNPFTPPWTAAPSAKERNAAQRAVTALLDELSPERVLKRSERLPAAIEQSRTPNGCLLQAATAAVSVSWFPEAAEAASVGELHVILWRGVASRRGSPPSREGAHVIGEMVLCPVAQPASGQLVWLAADGTLYDTDALAARCQELLKEQTDSAAGPSERSE